MKIFRKHAQPIVSSYSTTEYILKSDYVFFHKNEPFFIPMGFIWDGMSIPKPFWSLVGSPFCPKHLLAGLIHDYGYRTACLPRDVLDIIMKDILKDHGESRINIHRMYTAVRLFGSKHYKGKKG